MTAILDRQTTIVDKTEFGIIDSHSVRLEFSKYAKLGRRSKEQLLFGMASKHGLLSRELSSIMEEHRAFTPEQFLDFRLAIEHYQDIEKHQPV